ncbi:MAG: SLC13 family permease [Terriglobales bacterium]
MQNIAIWVIAGLSILLMLVRPRDWPEAVWPVAGAVLLVLVRVVSARAAAAAVDQGLDVYLFLAGMMMIAELARREGVFDWMAAHAVAAARGSCHRLFALVFGVGVVVTALLSNDATAVVLTPAILATTKAARARPLPYLMICAFTANAASFVLPISNPANLVVYQGGMPRLGSWIVDFGLASLLAIAATYAGLFLMSRSMLQGGLDSRLEAPPLTASGKLTLLGMLLLAATLLTASALGQALGAPACVAALVVSAAVTWRDRGAVAGVLRQVSWSVLPLVAGLFVLVEAVNGAGALAAAVGGLRAVESWAPAAGALATGFGVAIVSNLINNLPSGLIAGAAVRAAGVAGPLRNAVLVGVDLGPNMSVTGSLATILWLIALRREGQKVGFREFLKWGAVITPVALALALMSLLARRL